jgi:putative phage-type endonuclease
MIEQRTDEWFEHRRGRITASRVADLMAKTKSGYAASRQNYIMQLVLERITGKTEPTYQSPAMERGIELEPIAIARYEAENMVEVSPAEFTVHPTMEFLGGSADGVAVDRLLEVKCRGAKEHYQYLINGNVERGSIIQMNTCMMCYEMDKADFISFHPDFPEHLQLWVKTVERDEELVKEITAEVKQAEAEIKFIMDKLNKL